MVFHIEIEQAQDGRWIAEVSDLPGTLSPSKPHELLAGHQGPPGSRRRLRIGWPVKRRAGSHQLLARAGWPDFVFAFHDRDEIGPRMLNRVSKHTGHAFASGHRCPP